MLHYVYGRMQANHFRTDRMESEKWKFHGSIFRHEKCNSVDIVVREESRGTKNEDMIERKFDEGAHICIVDLFIFSTAVVPRSQPHHEQV